MQAQTAVFAFGPHGRSFENDVVVRFAASPDSAPRVVYWSQGATGEYSALSTRRLDEGRVEASTPHFSRGFVGTRAAPSDAGVIDARVDAGDTTVRDDASPDTATARDDAREATQDGSETSADGADESGACCSNGTCSEVTSTTCRSNGGNFFGADSSCAETNCPDETCGNGIVDPGELCDGNCPADCDDGNACTKDELTGSAAECNVRCVNEAITECNSGDGCCPSGCGSGDDSEC